MPGEWREISLGEFVRLQRGHDLTESQRVDGTIPVMGSAGVAGYHNVARAAGPGVTIGRSGVGSAGVVSYSPVAYWPHNTTLYVTDFLGNNPRFVYYRLQSMNLRSVDSGSAQASINRNFLYPLRLSVPNRQEQDEIARVLGTLDDKIELNRRMNATLEGLARAVFRSWFVDFDPVVAKAAGRRPVGMTAATAAQFPDTFEDSPLGPIPKGWEVKNVYSVADVVYGAPFASGLFNTKGLGLPLLRIRDLAEHNPVVYTTEKHLKGTQITKGDIVVGMDGEFRAHIWRGPNCLLNQRMCQFVPKPGIPTHFVLFSIEEDLAEVERSEVGTTVIHLGKADIDTFTVIVPTGEVLQAFGRCVGPLRARLITNANHTPDLTALRDALLPRLLSGELRLKDAERAASEVV